MLAGALLYTIGVCPLCLSPNHEVSRSLEVRAGALRKKEKHSLCGRNRQAGNQTSGQAVPREVVRSFRRVGLFQDGRQGVKAITL